MKRYRPNTKAVIVGIVLMLIGILCWVIKASFIPKRCIILIPCWIVVDLRGRIGINYYSFYCYEKK
ncbi:hypothetical protein IMAU30023_00589 [Lactobacillus helveticus]|nr:hypothetical protein [Lactobacillus helveticus]